MPISANAAIFVSHASADDEIVTRLHDALETMTGLNLWVDHRDIALGEDWQSEIDIALRTCPDVLLVLSRQSVQSREVIAEWRAALTLNRRLLIVIIDDVPPQDIPYRLHTIQWVNLHSNWDAGLAQLRAAIQKGDTTADSVNFTSWPITGHIDSRLTQIPISGREDELMQIKRLLTLGPTSIVGVGGVGKSRLAAEIVMTTEDANGVIWHTCSDVSRSEEIVELLRNHFGQAATTPQDEVLSLLRSNRRLIVIDSAEESTRRSDYVKLIKVLHDCGAQILLTSRVEWDDSELIRAFAPPPLSLEAAKKIVTDMEIAFGSPYDLTEQAEAIALAARQHPRLIEWAVRQTRRFPLEKVIQDLHALRSKKAQDALDEMLSKTLRQMTEQENPETTAALRKLAVCRDGFTYEAALAILELEDDTDELDQHLATLQVWQFVNMSVLEGNRTRYFIDQLVVAAVGEDTSAYETHTAYFLHLAEQRDQQQNYLLLDEESANLQAAFERMVTLGNVDVALRLANTCASFLYNRGRFEQCLSWYQALVTMVTDSSDNQPTWADIQHGLGTTYALYPMGNRRDNLYMALTSYTEALRHRTPETDSFAYAMTQNNVGEVYSNLADIEDRGTNLKRALEGYEEALQYWRPETDPLYYAIAMNNIGNTHRVLAQIEKPVQNLRRAISAYEEALQYRKAKEVPLDYAATQNNLAGAYRSLAGIERTVEFLNRAIAAYEESLNYRTPQTATLLYAATQNNLGLTYFDLAKTENEQQNLQLALHAFEESIAYRGPQIAPREYAATLSNIGKVYRKLARWEQPEEKLLILQRAIASFNEAIQYSSLADNPMGYAAFQNNLGLTYFDLANIENRTENLQRALSAYQEALRVRTPENSPRDCAMSLINLGNAYDALGDFASAVDCLGEAERLLRQLKRIKRADTVQRQIDYIKKKI